MVVASCLILIVIPMRIANTLVGTTDRRLSNKQIEEVASGQDDQWSFRLLSTETTDKDYKEQQQQPGDEPA